MNSLHDTLVNTGAGNSLYLLQLLDLESGLHRDILRWFAQQDIDLESLEWPHGQLYSVKFSSAADPRIQSWTDSWENTDGSSRNHDAYRMIMVQIEDSADTNK
jgi:hypothetical protein